MSQFVEECRREWKRLRVPDAVANEMAADLAADLKEAEAEGASAEEVLGSGAFDPRSFAASWAAERGVIQTPPVSRDRTPGRSRMPAATAAFAVIAIIGAVLALLASPSGPGRLALASGSVLPRLRLVLPPPPAASARVFAVGVSGSGVYLHTIGLILLIAGIVGLILSMLYSSPWASRSRWSSRYINDGPGSY